MAESTFNDACIILLPGKGRVPKPILDGILSALESRDTQSARLMIIDLDDTEAEGRKAAGAEERITPQTALLTIGVKIADRLIDGATTVVRDQYRDDRAARDYILNKYSKPYWER